MSGIGELTGKDQGRKDKAVLHPLPRPKSSGQGSQP
jgi:hypothetical protein